MRPGTAENNGAEHASRAEDAGSRVSRLVADLANVSDQLTMIAKLGDGSADSASAERSDGELRLLKSLAELQRACADINSLEHAIRALDAEIDSNVCVSQRTGSQERASR